MRDSGSAQSARDIFLIIDTDHYKLHTHIFLNVNQETQLHDCKGVSSPSQATSQQAK